MFHQAEEEGKCAHKPDVQWPEVNNVAILGTQRTPRLASGTSVSSFASYFGHLEAPPTLAIIVYIKDIKKEHEYIDIASSKEVLCKPLTVVTPPHQSLV